MLRIPHEETFENAVIFKVVKFRGYNVGDKIFPYVSMNNRAQVVFADGKEYSLEVDRILSIYYDGNYYYVVYETKNKDFYKAQFPKSVVDALPKFVIKLKVEKSSETIEFCRCGSIIEWDADEPYCPRCGDEDFEIVRKGTKRVLIIHTASDAQIEELLIRQYIDRKFPGASVKFIKRLEYDEVWGDGEYAVLKKPISEEWVHVPRGKWAYIGEGVRIIKRERVNGEKKDRVIEERDGKFVIFVESILDTQNEDIYQII